MRLTHIIVNSLLTGALLVAGNAIAADVAAGKAKSAMCAACHGANGISAIEMYPNLAGQKKGYTVSQLKAFKNGDRKNPIMGPMSMGLSSADMDNIAAYYASLKP